MILLLSPIATRMPNHQNHTSIADIQHFRGLALQLLHALERVLEWATRGKRWKLFQTHDSNVVLVVLHKVRLGCQTDQANQILVEDPDFLKAFKVETATLNGETLQVDGSVY